MSISSLLVRGLNAGHWVWNDQTDNLEFVSEVPEKKRRRRKEVRTRTAINGLTYATLKVDIKFRFTVSEAELVEFRHYLKEKNKNRTDTIVTIEDVKVVAIFLCCQQLPAVFHQFYNLLKVDQLLRACIVYMEFYLQTCENLIKTQSYLPAQREDKSTYRKLMQDLEDLRVLIGRFYAGIIFAELGTSGDSVKISRTDEILLFEYFLRVSTIVIWIALERKYLNTIKAEIGRIFRTEHFTGICRAEGGNLLSDVKKKNCFVLRGKLSGENAPGRKPNRLVSTSPIVKNFLAMDEPKLVMIGKEDLTSLRDARLKFLMNYIFRPEKEIYERGIAIGILGYHRRLFDSLLYPCTKRNLKLLVTGSPMDISEDRKKLREVALETSLRESETQHLHHFDHLPKIPAPSE